MTIPEFVGLFDKQKITEGRIRFLFYPPIGFPCKYWCTEETDANSLIKSISQDGELMDCVIDGLEEVFFEDKIDYLDVIVKF